MQTTGPNSAFPNQQTKPVADGSSLAHVAPRRWYAALVPKLVRRRMSVSSTGAMVCLVVLGVLAASSFWTLRSQQEVLDRSRIEQIRVVTSILEQAIEPLLAADEVSGVRRLVSESAIANEFERCSIELGDGSVVAATYASMITAVELPTKWPTLRADLSESEETIDRGVMRVSRVLYVAGKGQAVLHVDAPVNTETIATSDTTLGAAVIAGVALGWLLWAQRRLGRTVRGLEAIRGGLRAVAEERDARGALDVHRDLVPEARAWNQLIHARDAYVRREAIMAVATNLAGGGGGAATETMSTIDALWNGIIVVDHGSRVRYANGAAGVLLGVRKDQLIDADITTLPVPESMLVILRDVVEGRTRQRQSFDVEGQSPGGDRTVLRASIKPMRKEDSAAAIVVIEDVTQQRVADESRNAIIGQVAHELRTPLTNIRLYVEALVDDNDQDAKARARSINVISQESRRLERIVGDMLSVSEIEAGGLKLRVGDVRLDALFEEMHEDFRAQAQDKEIELVFELPPKLPVVQADRDKVVLTLHNLVGNALKYTPAGGRVIVRATAVEGSFRVDVVDNGIGIKPEEHELVFERFYRAKDNRINSIAGSGLGLALARNVARMHGGDIMISSQVDKGSTFTLVLPMNVAQGRAAVTSERNAA